MDIEVTYHRANVRAGLLASLSAVAAIVLASPALAADPKPDAAIKNKNIEARVFLDDKIKADASLAADCLAEGKKWLDKNAADAAASRKQDPQFFKDGGWDFERKYSIRSVVADRYVGVLRDDYMDTHGAHPNSDVNTVLWDKSESKRISIRPFFAETADNGTTMKALVKAVIASLKIEKKKTRQQRDRDRRMVQERGAEPAQDRRRDARAVDRNRQELRPHLPLPALCGRPLRRGPICRIRSVGDIEALSHPGGGAHLRRRAAKGDADGQQ
ncbi:hypothetical protein ACVWYH_000422 [Bradyrhizobium sp. GM24.11]